MATQYNQLAESNENLEQNPSYFNNIKTNKIYNNSNNINMIGENNNNNMIIEDEFNQEKNNLNQNNFSSEFNPNLRPPQSLHWRNIMKIDIDFIRNSKDLSLLNSCLENIIYSNITEDDIQAVPEENVAKLIKILQFLNEYLLEQRQIINNQLISLQKEGNKLQNDQQYLDAVLIKQKDYLNKLRQDAKIRLKQITDYKNAVNVLLKDGRNNFRGKNIKITDINMDINKNINTYGYNNNYNFIKSGYKCKYCTGKIFPSEFELKKHLSDIHLISQFNEPQPQQILKAPPQTKSQITMPIDINLQPLNLMNNNANNNNQNGQLEKKINDMRYEFQNQMHQFELNKLKNQLLAQKNLNDNGDNCKQQMEKMGNAFNDTLKQVLGVLINNNQQQQEPPKIIKRKKKPKNPNLDDEINLIKNEIAKANLESQEYDTKIIKKRNEINILNIKKQELINSMPQKKTQFIPKKKILVPTQNTYLLFSKTNIPPKIKFNKFHSGPMISDHDDTDNEKKRKEKIKHELTEKTQMMDIIINMPSKDSGKIRVPDYTERLKYNPKLKLPDEMIEEEKLDHFYKRYKNRDNNFLNKPRFNNYKVVLPSDFNEESNVNINAKVLMREGIKKQAKFFSDNIKNYKIGDAIEIKDLEEMDKDNLKQAIDALLINMDYLNEKVGEKEEKEHYASMKTLLNFEKLKKINKKNFDD